MTKRSTERGRALEWSRARAAWRVLGLNAQIQDPALAVPLPIKALVNVAKADDAVARALIAKRNPVIKAVRSQGSAEGERKGLAEALLVILTTRGVSLKSADRARTLGEQDPDRLHCWIARAVICTDIAEVFGQA